MAATTVVDDVTVFGGWLRTIAGIPTNKINTVLPDVALWADTGFVQVVGVVGGTEWIDANVHSPVLEVDTWGARLNTEKPDWGKASRLMNLIRDAAADPAKSVGVRLDFPDGQAAVIKTLWPVSSPRRPLSGIDQGDPASFARLMIDIQMIWIKVPDTEGSAP
jgi:hypothetical protein